MSEPAVIAMMMAMDRNKLIGRNGAMPWHIPGEQAYFKQVTLGKPVIMGRKTFESIGKPLVGRVNIVVTRNTRWEAEGVRVVHSLHEALQVGRQSTLASLAASAAVQTQPEPDNSNQAATTQVTAANPGELMVIGGAALCRDAMPLTQRLYLTVVDHEYEGDTWLDSFSWNDWQRVSEDVRDPTTTGGLAVTYWVLERCGD